MDSLILDGTANILSLTDCGGSINEPGLTPCQLPSVKPTDIAFIMFTSGSTGTPKGVLIQHESICTSIQYNGEAEMVTSSTRGLQFSSYAFDTSVDEIFTVLSRGGCVCVPTEAERMNHLAAFISRFDVNWLSITPTVARLIAPGEVPSVRTIVLGGEEIDPGVVNHWKDHAELVASYGPAEASIACAASPVTSVVGDALLGRPVASSLWVVDPSDHDALMPIGTAGELVIGGPLVARGYLNDPDRTSLAFVCPKWSTELNLPFNRFYRTGDMARWNVDGTLSYVGRLDTQVKLNGQRVELGEVERHLLAQPCLQCSTCAVPQSGLLANRLVGVIGLQTPQISAADEFHCLEISQARTLVPYASDAEESLRAKLPPYMVPTVWIGVQSLPLNASGKLDRRKVNKWLETFQDEDTLNIFQLVGSEQEAEDEPPLTPIQQTIRNIWADVLGRTSESIGLQRSFFALGGDSVAAIRVVAQCRQANLQLTVQDVFQARTIQSLAACATAIIEKPMETVSSLLEPSQCENPESELAKLDSEVLSGLGGPENIEEIYPCSPMQEGILFSRSSIGGSYDTRLVVEVLPRDGGEVDLDRLKNAWAAVVRRHPILRTVFADRPSDDSAFIQVTFRKYRPVIMGCETSEQSLDDMIAMPVQPFDDRRNPPHRFTVCTSSQRRVFILLEISHVLTDAVSIDIIWRDLQLAYEGALTTSKAPRYSRFVSYLQGTSQKDHMAYWLKFLKDAEPCFFPHLGTGNQKGATRAVSVTISRAMTDHIRQFCASLQITVANLIQVMWSMVLRSYTGMDDVSFGYITSGRDLPLDGIDDLVGPLISMMISRVRYTPSMKVADVIKQVGQDTVASMAHQHCSLAAIHREVGLKSRSLFNTVLTVVRPHSTQSIDSSLQLTQIASSAGTSEFDVVLEVSDSGVELDTTLAYSESALRSEDATNLSQAIVCALNWIIAHPESLVDHLSLCSPDLISQMTAMNNASPEWELRQCLHELISLRAHRQPDSPALWTGQGTMTYSELDSKSTMLARQLISLGVRPGSLVPICLSKSTVAVLAMLAIMKAGGAFVPLDPLHPTQRLADLVQRTGAKLILSSANTRNSAEFAGPRVVEVEQLLSRVTSVNEIDGVCPAPDPEGIAYVLFTSGSTGVPKGVVVPHRAVCCSIRAHSEAMNINTTSRSLQFASYTFDACICEIFSVLVAGGTVCIPSEEERVHDLAGFITRSQANWAFFTPTVIRTLGLSPSQVPSLRTLVLGGEVVTVHDARTWAGHVSLFNGYGPTETCVFCATTPIHPDGVTYGRIGRPIGCAAWVVRPDNHDILLPPGCPGELLIEGPIVSQGYLNDPVRTQEAFITHPAWAQNRKLSQNQSSARRFYKTGDLVRQSPDGTLVYMARLDSQVKINGQRLDLGEIRHQIHSVVSEDVQVFIDLLPPTCLPNEKALLVAFLASTRFEPEQTSGFSPPIKTLTSQLEQDLPRLLPRYMIPSVYLPLSAIPLTSGGKVDRQALRRRVSRMSMKELLVYTGEEQGTKLPVSTAEEQQMQMLWAEVLRIPPETIGASDHFFRLGADSIDGMKLVALAQRHGILITLADIFRSPRLSDLATLLESPAHPDDSKHDLKTIIPAFSLLNVHSRNTVLKEIKADYALDVSQIEDIYPCTPLQESLMAASIQSHGAYVHHLVEKLPPSGEVPAIMSAWQSVIKMTPILRTRIVQTVSAGLLQVVLKESVQWLHRRQAIQEYLDEDARHSMTLGDPLLRLACLHDPGTPHTGHIVITIHHSIYDGWSLPHIRKLVYATQNGHPCSTSLPFNRFIHYLEQKSDSRASDSFWQSFLYRSQPLAFPPLPSTGYQPVGTDSVQLSVHWPSTFPPSAFTLSTFVRVAWALVLGSYSGTDDVIFGLSLSGRDTPIPGILDILGPTICTVPFRVKFSGESFGALLERAHADSAAMLPYQHIGLHHIRQLGPDCQLACDFQTLLVIQPARDPSDPEPHSELTFTSSGGLTYAFALICQPHPSGIELHGDFDSNCVSRPVAERLLSQMKSVMGTLIFGDRRKLAAEVDVIGISQKATLATWQREPLQPGEGRVEDLIISRAQQAPDDLAIHAWDGELTYNELVEESATLAENLKRRGIGPGMLVPLCFVKSIYYVVTLLAVTRTGAAFVPIDPDAPIERMQKILKLTNACCILTSASLAEQTRAKAPARVAVFAIPLDRSARMSTDSDLMPGQSIVSHEAVYVLFTSGSTGIPKGVVVTHSSMKSSLKAHGRRLGLSESSRVLQFSNHTFDVSLLEILTTLAYGGCVCIPSDGDRVNRLSEYMRDAKVNFAILTPSVAQILSPVSVPDLRTLALAGEAWGQEIVNIWRDSVRLFNAYGPTEATILSAIGEVDAQCFRPNNIGSGSGALCWVTSPTDPTRLMAIGAAGELLLEGPILAQGYLGEEEKTRAAFIDPPMWRRELSSHGAPPCRSSLYRTGDLARYEEDGSITYLGRMDGQVKIRGQRTELSEIEHHILASDAVRNAVVLLRKNKLVCVLSLQSTSLTPALSRPGDIRPVSDDDRDAALRICLSIRAGLARKVPEYMVPDLWVPVIDLPLSSSGKLARKGVDDWLASVDTKHLINLSLQKIPLSTTSPSPNIASSSVERAIRQVIAGALQLPVQQVSVDAPFTALGGDSITAILVASKLRNMGILLTMRDILEFPSIQHLASREDLTAPSPANLPLDVEQVNVPFELTPIQRFFFCFFPDGANHFNQSILVRVARRFTYDQWITSLRALVQRHGMLRARFSNVDNNLQQRITDESEGACCVKWHTLEAMDPSYISTALDRCERRIDIFQGPICAVEIFDFPHEQIFFIAAHHLVMDFVSQQILLKDLDSLLAGEELSTPRPLSFQAWSLKQIEYGSNLALSPQAVLPHHENVPLANLNYWGIAAMDSCYADSAVRVLEFDSTVTSSLVGDANRAFNSEPIELFIASLLHSFANTFTDRSAPAIFKEGHGRQTREPRLDPSSTVGWFTTITPIALAVSPQLSTFEDTLRRVKDICRAIPANGFDYFTSRFLNASGSSAFQSHGPMMEIVLNYAGVLNNVQQGGTLFCPIATEEQRQMRYHDINPQLRRFAVFDIYAQVAGGKLSFTFAYSPSLNYQDRISAWIESLRRLLEAISVDLPAKQPQKTLADYPRARLDYTALERLHKDIIPSLYPAKLDDVWECSPTQTVMLRARSYQPLFFSPHFIWKIAGTRASEGNRERLTKAWKRIVARHSVLRSVFTSQLTATYHQIVLANPPFFITWADMAGKESPSEALRRLPPLPSDELHLAFRLTASEDDEGDLFCRLDINHALIDHVSINVILSDVIAVYGGQPMDSDSAFSTFRDYVEYSHLRLVDGEPYWQDRLHDACPCVLTQRPYRQSPGVLFSKSVSVNASALKALCLSSGFTLASLFQACWAVLLQCYVGSDDVLFGYIASNRGLPIRGIDRMVGLLISILPRRVRLSPSASSVSEQVRAIAKHIHEQLHDDLEHHMSAGNTMAEVIQRGRCIEELLFPFDTAINFRSQPSAAVNSVSSDPTSPLQFADGQDPMPVSHQP